MTITYKSVFEVKGMKFGWYKKELYRLPQNYNGKFLPLLKLPKMKIGQGFGYQLNQKQLSLRQLESMTTDEVFEVHAVDDDDLPF